MLKQIKDLEEGKCIAVTADGMEYEAAYDSELHIVFFCIPSHKTVIGYKQ